MREFCKVSLTGKGYYLIVLIVAVGVALVATATNSWPTAVGYLLVAAAITLIFLRPTVGLWLLLVTLPFQRIYPVDLFIGRLTLPRTIVLVTMLALVIQNLIVRSDHGRFLRTPFNRPLLALIVAWIASSFMSINIDSDTQIQVFVLPSASHLARYKPFLKSYTEIISYLVSVVALYIMSSLLRSTKLTFLAIKFWIMGAIIACLVGLYATLGYYYNLPVPEEISNTYYLMDPGSFADVSRIKSITNEPRHFTYYLITILPFLIITGLYYKQYVVSRKFHLGALGLVGFSFWMTMSRSMVILGIAMLVFLPITAVMVRSKLSLQNLFGTLHRAVLLPIILLALTAVLLFAISGVNFISAILALFETINPEQGSTGPQLMNNIIAFSLFLESPVLGVGIGNFVFFATPLGIPNWVFSKYGVSDSPVHVTSLYLQTLSEVGIVGLVALLYLFVTIGRSTIHTIRMAIDERSNAIAVGLAGSFVMIALAAAFIPNFFNPETWVVLGFIAVMLRNVASGQQVVTMSQSETSAGALQLPRP